MTRENIKNIEAKRDAIAKRLKEIQEMSSERILLGMMDEWKIDLLVLVFGVGAVQLSE